MKLKKLPFLNKLLKNDKLSTLVKFYFAFSSFGEDYDPYENNKTFTDLNPISVKMYVREIEGESLIWRKMGTQEVGAKEILCDEKYGDYFRRANRIVIDEDDYEVYREAVGGNVMIQQRPFHYITVIIRKK